MLVSLFFLVYLFAAATPLRSEFVLDPRWVVDILGEATTRSGNENLVPFRLGDRFGYIGENGSLAASMRLPSSGVSFEGKADDDSPSDVALSDTAFAVYSSDYMRIEAKAPDGSTLFLSDLPGIPYFSNDRRFLVSPGMDAIGEYRSDGYLAWNYEFPAIITAFEATREFTVAGLMNGMVEGVDRNGARNFSFETGGSRIPVIYGLAVSGSGDAIALVCGLDRQRFIYLERKGGDFRVAHHRYLDSSYRSPVAIRFSADGRFAYFAQPEGISVFDAKKRSFGSVPFVSTNFDVLTEGGKGFVILSSSIPEGRMIICVDPPGRVIFSHLLPSGISFVAMRGESLYLGIDDRVARLDFKEE